MPIADRARDVRARAEITSRRARRAISGEPRGPRWLGTTLIGLMTGAAGAGLACLLDPARGRARRARLIDQGGATLRRGLRRVDGTIRSASATVSGAIAAATHSGEAGEAFPDDVTLTSKVESQLFRDPAVPKGSININVERGIVVLRGEVPDTEMRDRLASEAAAIGGVWSVHNMLHVAGEPAEAQLPAGART